MEKRYLTLEEAHAYTTWSKDHLKSLVTNNIIRGGHDVTKKTSPWVIDKKSIDDYIHSNIFKNSNTDFINNIKI
jgi:hypothetical protein